MCHSEWLRGNVFWLGKEHGSGTIHTVTAQLQAALQSFDHSHIATDGARVVSASKKHLTA